MKKAVLTLCILVLAAFLTACTSGIRETEFLNELVNQNIIQKELNEQNSTYFVSELENESSPLSEALSNGNKYFGDVYTSNGVIWQFLPDGIINAYENETKSYQYTYELSYNGADFANKYIELISDDGSARKFRFKKVTSAGFDIVYINSNGNDADVFTFMKSSFYNALFEKLPYFNETYYESNVVWNFKDDGTLKTYDINGEVYEYIYNLSYTQSEDEVLERLLTITANAGQENEKSIYLKLVSFTASQFSCLNITENSGDSVSVVTFTKK